MPGFSRPGGKSGEEASVIESGICSLEGPCLAYSVCQKFNPIEGIKKITKNETFDNNLPLFALFSDNLFFLQPLDSDFQHPDRPPYTPNLDDFRVGYGE